MPAIEQIYEQLTQIFGGTNPRQFFAMMMPGITLDAKTYAYDTTQEKPATVMEAESKLVDQMFDVAQVSGGPNGQRVSLQYQQALSVLIPQFNPVTPVLKKTMRDFLNTPVPPNTLLDGQPFTGSLMQFYFKLYESWIARKLEWDKLIGDKKTELSSNPKTEKELFLEWYDEIAEAELAKVDEAMGKVLGVYSPSDMDAILGALASGPGGQIDEALNMVKDLRLASPNGGYFYPVDLTPDDWFLDLQSDLDPVDLLQDPAFISASLAAKKKAIEASLAQAQNLMRTMPKEADIQAAAKGLQTAQSDYTNAQNAILNQYTDNALAGVELALKLYPPTAAATIAADKLSSTVKNVSTAKGQNPPESPTFTNDDVKKLVDGQKNLVTAQSSWITAAQKVADAGLALAQKESGNFSDLPLICQRLKSQLADLDGLQNDLNMAVAAQSRKATNNTLGTVYNDDTQNAANEILKAAQDATKADGATAANVALSAPEYTSAPTAHPKADTAALNQIHTAATTANTQTGATPQTVLDAITASVNQILPQAPSSKKSLTSDRFMELQWSFSVDDISSDSSDSATSKQSSWACDFFLGSASGRSSSSSSVSTKNSMESSKEIKIGLKAARVDIERGWFDPGVFKLSKEMSRLSSMRVSKGQLPVVEKQVSPTAQQTPVFEKQVDWDGATDLNEAILPCFPVSFLVAKDVTISFQATESSLSAVKSVMDSRSASGGGFLCFSASGSSASSGSNSSLKSKTEGTTCHISMPGPQILGWFLETTPEDKSTELTVDDISKADDDVDSDAKAINIIQFVRQISKLNQAAANKDLPMLPAARADIGNGNGGVDVTASVRRS